MILYESLLSGMDKVMEQGDLITDPFYVLNVKDINASVKFVDLLNNLDDHKLYNETTNFNYADWEEYMRCTYFLTYNDHNREMLARFAWWLCHQAVYEQKGSKNIDLSKIISDKSLYKSVRLYIYTSNVVDYVIHISAASGADLQIRFKNNTELTKL